jgi:hypothetical protein
VSSQSWNVVEEVNPTRVYGAIAMLVADVSGRSAADTVDNASGAPGVQPIGQSRLTGNYGRDPRDIHSRYIPNAPCTP